MRKPVRRVFDPHEFLVHVVPGKAVNRVRKNQVIFRQGSASDCVFYLQNGRVKLTVTSEQGREAVVGMIEPEQFFGEGCLTGQLVRICTARAVEGCEITSITKEVLRAVMHDETKFSELFITYLLTRNSRIEDDLIDQLFNSSEKRLARLLSKSQPFWSRNEVRDSRCALSTSSLLPRPPAFHRKNARREKSRVCWLVR